MWAILKCGHMDPQHDLSIAASMSDFCLQGFPIPLIVEANPNHVSKAYYKSCLPMKPGLLSAIHSDPFIVKYHSL